MRVTSLQAIYASIYIALIAIVVTAWYPVATIYFASSLAETLIALSVLSALLGVTAILVQLVLISRAPWIEPIFGHDRLARMHAVNGIVGFALVTTHIPLIVAGYALRAEIGFIEQLAMFQSAYQYVPLAILAHLVLTLTVVTSIVIVRRKLPYEWWHRLHLLNYTVLLLALTHQVLYGSTLGNSEWFRLFWFALHGAVFINIIWFRFIWPLLMHARRGLFVEKIEEEAEGIISIYIASKKNRLPSYRAGQFMEWRFMQSGLWRQEHPFSISCAPNDKYVRISVKAVGDFTAALHETLRVGTPVIASGPLGRFTRQRAGSTQKLLLVAGGIGITPLRAIIEETPESCDLWLIYQAKDPSHIAFKEELDRLCASSNLRVVYALSQSSAPGMETGRIDGHFLRRHVGDIEEREVFICGPPAMIDSLRSDLVDTGVSLEAIHTERFSL